MKIAVVTGASSGMGRQFALQLTQYEKFDEMWVIARRQQPLEELRAQVGCPVRPICLDLADSAALASYSALLQQHAPQVAVLVNCAGFGKFGRYYEIPLEDCMGMIDLNCKALVAMTQLTLPYMAAGGRIVQLDSLSAFQPVPYLNVYAATKAFVLHYTRALREELSSRGVLVTAVCPYWLKTEFMSVARDTANPEAVRHTPFAMRPEAAAAWSLTMSGLGVGVVTCGPIPFLMRVGGKALPACVPMALWDKLRKI